MSIKAFTAKGIGYGLQGDLTYRLNWSDSMGVPQPTLSKSGYSDRVVPTLVSWGARALYIGPSFKLDAHRNAVAVVAIGLDQPLGFAHDPLEPAAGYRMCRSALIWPNSLHHLEARGTTAFLYLDPESRDFETVRDRAGVRGESISFDICGDRDVADSLNKFARNLVDWPQAQKTVERGHGLVSERQVDARISAVMASLRQRPAEPRRASDFARDCGLSDTRFQHLFTEAAGLPFRRYRLWCRLAAALRVAHAGASLTEAAHAAGLASSAHLSKAFHAMFGLAPSQLNIRELRFFEVP